MFSMRYNERMDHKEWLEKITGDSVNSIAKRIEVKQRTLAAQLDRDPVVDGLEDGVDGVCVPSLAVERAVEVDEIVDGVASSVVAVASTGLVIAVTSLLFDGLSASDIAAPVTGTALWLLFALSVIAVTMAASGALAL